MAVDREYERVVLLSFKCVVWHLTDCIMLIYLVTLLNSHSMLGLWNVTHERIQQCFLYTPKVAYTYGSTYHTYQASSYLLWVSPMKCAWLESAMLPLCAESDLVQNRNSIYCVGDNVKMSQEIANIHWFISLKP